MPDDDTQLLSEQSSVSEVGGKWTWFSKLRKSRWGRVFFTVMATAVIGLTGYYVAVKVAESIKQVILARIVLQPWPIFMSILVTTFSVLSGGVTWYLVLRSIGTRAVLKSSVRAYLLASLAGYIPGYGWKYLGKVYLTSRSEVSPIATSLAALLEFLGLAISRLAVALFFLTPGFWHRTFGNAPGALLWILRVAVLLCMILLPWIFRLLQNRKSGYLSQKAGIRVNLPAFWLVEAIMCLEWIVFGMGFALLLSSMTTLLPSQFAEAIFASTTSYLVSLLTFFVPGGIGVRESVLIYTLAGVLPEALVALSAVLYRLVVIVAELLGALVGIGLRNTRRVADNDSKP